MSYPVETDEFGNAIPPIVEGKEKSKQNELWCPLGDKISVSKRVIKFLEEHQYIDVIKEGEYLFTLKRMEKREP